MLAIDPVPGSNSLVVTAWVQLHYVESLGMKSKIYFVLQSLNFNFKPFSDCRQVINIY